MKEILSFAVIAGIIAFAGTLLLFLGYYDELDLRKARTVALTASVLFELAVVFVTRAPEGKSVFRHNPVNNKFLVFAVGLAFALQLFIIYVEPLQIVFQLTTLEGLDWLWIVLFVFAGIAALDGVRLWQAKRAIKKIKS